jgi:hypothetical protein
MEETIKYKYCIPTEWYRKNLYNEYKQTLVFENKGLRIITSLCENIATIETLFVSMITMHDLLCPISIENISTDMKDILKTDLFEYIIIEIYPELNKIQIYSNLSSHAFKYKTDYIIVRDNPYNLDFGLKITHESFITIEKMIKCSAHVKHVHSISIHSSVSNNNIFLSGYDSDNNKRWVFIQEKSKWSPGEGATRVQSQYFVKVLEIIKNQIKFTNILKIKITTTGVLILIVSLNDGTYMKSIIAPMLNTQSGGDEVLNDA